MQISAASVVAGYNGYAAVPQSNISLSYHSHREIMLALTSAL